MKVLEICFSPTGGTKKVLEILAKALDCDVVTVDLADRNADFEGVAIAQDDVALIAAPSYAGRVPAVAAERIGLLHGNGACAIVVGVYGNRAYDDTLVELVDVAKVADFKIVAAIAAVAEHSIVRCYGAGRPDEHDRELLVEFVGHIAQKLASGDTSEPFVPGNRPYRLVGNVGLVPQPTCDCEKCGICAKQCPVGAIDNNNVSKVDAAVCISCMRCVAICPHSARKISDSMMLSVNQMLEKVCSTRKSPELYL